MNNENLYKFNFFETTFIILKWIGVFWVLVGLFNNIILNNSLFLEIWIIGFILFILFFLSCGCIMKISIRREIKELIVKFNLDCSIEEFRDKANWVDISIYKYLSENFIREFQDKVYWWSISCYQRLSEQFIYEFKGKLDIRTLIDRYMITRKELEQEFKKRNRFTRFEIMEI